MQACFQHTSLGSLKMIQVNIKSVHRSLDMCSDNKVCAFTYGCETTLNITLHLQVNSCGHVHFAVLCVPVKH